MESLIIKNMPRSIIKALSVICVIVAMGLVFAIVMSSLDFKEYKIERTVEISGTVRKIDRIDNGYYISVSGEYHDFFMDTPYTRLLPFSEAVEKIKEGDNINIRLLKKNYERASDNRIMGIEINGMPLFTIEDGIAAYKKYHYTNLTVVSALLCVSVAVAIVLAVKVKRLPNVFEVEYLKYAQAKYISGVQTPFRKKIIKYIIPIFFILLTLLIAVIVIGETQGETTLFFIFLSLFMVPLVLLICFLGLILKALRKKEISIFVNKLDFKQTALFEPQKACFFEIMGAFFWQFTENSVKMAKAEDVFIIENQLPNETELPDAEPFAEYETNLEMNYSILNWRAEACYMSSGVVMAIFLIADITSAEQRRAYINLINEECVTNEDFEQMDSQGYCGLLMFELTQELYDYVMYYCIEVDGLKDLIENREKYMCENCADSLSKLHI